MCLNAAWQVYRLSQATRLRCKRHTPHIPQFWVVSEHDETVSTAENVRIFNALTHPQKQLVFYGDPGRSGAKSHTQFRPCAYPEQRVLSLSHYCMATAPDNPHFGYASQYMDLAHYQPPLPVLPRHETLMFSATSHPPPEGQLYGRTSFNPDFYGLMAEIGDWLKRAF